MRRESNLPWHLRSPAERAGRRGLRRKRLLTRQQQQMIKAQVGRGLPGEGANLQKAAQSRRELLELPSHGARGVHRASKQPVRSRPAKQHLWSE